MANNITGDDWSFGLRAGSFGAYVHADNETEHRSSKADPPAQRFAVDEDKVEHNLGKTSFNTRRIDSGVHDEHALIQGQLHGVAPGASVRSGFGGLEFCTRGPGKEPVDQRMFLSHESAVFHVPIVAPNLGGGATPTGRNELRAPGGVFWLVIQETDGNVVAYRNTVPFDYSTGVPYWNSGPAPKTS